MYPQDLPSNKGHAAGVTLHVGPVVALQYQDCQQNLWPKDVSPRITY